MAREELVSTKFNVWWVLCAALIAVVLVGAVAIGFFAGRNQDSKAEEQQPAPTSAGGAPSAAAGGACGVPADDQDYPTEAPETNWELYKNVASVPTSQTYGPTKKDGAFWKCFARSPKGALFASFNLSQAFVTGKVYEAAVDTPGAKDIYDENSAVADSEGAAVEVAGFQIESYTETDATIVLLLKVNGQLGQSPMNLVWDESADDWRWDVENTSPPEPVENDDGFTSWSPRG